MWSHFVSLLSFKRWLERNISIGSCQRHSQLPVPLHFVLSHVRSIYKSQEVIMIQIYPAYSLQSTPPFAPQSITEAMHGSSLALRPRQRTSTSCTECRRRKQKVTTRKSKTWQHSFRKYLISECSVIKPKIALAITVPDATLQ